MWASCWGTPRPDRNAAQIRAGLSTRKTRRGMTLCSEERACLRHLPRPRHSQAQAVVELSTWATFFTRDCVPGGRMWVRLLRIVRDAIAMRPGGVGAAEAERTVRIGNAGFHVATIGRAGEQAAVLPVTRAPRRLHALATRPPRPIALRLRAHEWVTRARASQWSRLGGHGRNCGRVAGRSDVVVVRAAHGGRAAGEREREDQPDSACHFGVNPL